MVDPTPDLIADHILNITNVTDITCHYIHKAQEGSE